jgi:ribose transport system ATP-binding protein
MTVEPSPAPVLSVRGLSKSFGGAQALRDVALTVRPGEVHGLLGENGSGKSTLIKILAGFHDPDDGELEMSGEPVKLPLAPGQFRELGMSFVHQDLGLVPSLSVVENLRIGELAASRRQLHISWGKERRRARETFERFGQVSLPPEARVADLLPVERALLAIVRAVEGIREVTEARDGHRGLLVLDEPTVFLPRTGIERLFALVREITATGASVLFVSHDLDEVMEITDRVTVLRDGRVVGTVDTREATESKLVELIIGRGLEQLVTEHHDPTKRTVAASIRGLSGGMVEDFSVELHEGEVLGLTGLVGSGFEEIPYLVFGAERAEKGELIIGNVPHALHAMSPQRALELGMAMLPADRQRDGAVGSLSVGENMMLQVVEGYYERLRLNRGRLQRDAGVLCRQYDVRPANPRAAYQSLSGGNQQKALLAKWLQMDPALLLLHEPTQGVDVGARQQIFSLIRDAAERRHTVVCASSDYEQLSTVCDRVLIFGRGRVVSELVGQNVTKDRITQAAYSSMGSGRAVA